MGYRHRFAAADASFVNLVKNMTVEELKSYIVTNNLKGYDQDEDYLQIYEILNQTEIFDFGKDCFFAQELINRSEHVFTHPSVEQALDDVMMVVSREGFLFVIEEFRKRIYNNFKEHFEADADIQKAYFASKMSEWGNISDEIANELDDNAKQSMNEKFRPYNTDTSSDDIVRSWLYEYEIFELVRLYKTFDWDNQVLLFYGW